MNRTLTIAWLIFAAGFCGALLSGCATTQEPQVRIVEKTVPVAVPCVSDRTPAPPIYPDADDALRAAPSAAARYALMAAGRLLRVQRLAELEPAVAACRMPARQIDGGGRGAVEPPP